MAENNTETKDDTLTPLVQETDGFSIIDHSKTFTFTITDTTTVEEIARKYVSTASKYIDKIIQDMGYTRVDTYGDHSSASFDFNSEGMKDNVIWYCFNVYKKDDSNYFTFSPSFYLDLYRSNSISFNQSNQILNILTTSDYGAAMGIIPSFYFSRVNPLDGITKIFASNNKNTIMLNYYENFPYPNLYNSWIQTIWDTTFTANYTTATWTIKFGQIKNNKYNFISFDPECKTPLYGLINIQNKNYMTYLIPATLGNNKVFSLNSDISNILIFDNEEYFYAPSNLITSKTFSNLGSDFPLVPVYCCYDSLVSNKNYNFEKSLSGIYQVSGDFSSDKGSRYKLENKIFRNMGNGYIFEEGTVLE